jgi:hypothetical protein
VGKVNGFLLIAEGLSYCREWACFVARTATCHLVTVARARFGAVAVAPRRISAYLI